MRAGRSVLIAAVVIAAVFLFAQPHAMACPSCYGAADSPMTDGMNMAIVSLLGVTGSVLVGFVAFFLYVRRRAMTLKRRFVGMLN